MDDLREWFGERWGLLVAGLTAGLMGLWWWQGRPVSQPAGILVSEDPIQAALESPVPWTFRKHTLTPLAHFELRARVLGTERYRFDRAAELSPVDFALGWGALSDSRTLDAISIKQRDRWYFWSASSMSVSETEVATHSGNMHMIPSTDAVAKRLLAVRPGQIVELRGQLVRVEGKDGFR